jgi:hypothetical protein
MKTRINSCKELLLEEALSSSKCIQGVFAVHNYGEDTAENAVIIKAYPSGNSVIITTNAEQIQISTFSEAGNPDHNYFVTSSSTEADLFLEEYENSTQK